MQHLNAGSNVLSTVEASGYTPRPCALGSPAQGARDPPPPRAGHTPAGQPGPTGPGPGPRDTDWETPRGSLWSPRVGPGVGVWLQPSPSAQSAECWSTRSRGLGEGRRRGLGAGTAGRVGGSGFWTIGKIRFYPESSLEAKCGSAPPPTRERLKSQPLALAQPALP